jgi:HlyD family secretion protein
VRRVEPAAFTKISTLGVEEQRVNVLIDIVSSPQEWMGLGDAYQVDTRITVFSRDDVTVIPSGALFRTGETWNVYVVSEGRAQRRAVELLRRSGRFAAVTTGVQPGEHVIIYPSDRVASDVVATTVSPIIAPTRPRNVGDNRAGRGANQPARNRSAGRVAS